MTYRRWRIYPASYFVLEYNKDDVLYCPLPLFHGSALMAFTAPALFAGRYLIQIIKLNCLFSLIIRFGIFKKCLRKLIFYILAILGITFAFARKFSVTNFWSDCIKHEATVMQYIGKT